LTKAQSKAREKSLTTSFGEGAAVGIHSVSQCAMALTSCLSDSNCTTGTLELLPPDTTPWYRNIWPDLPFGLCYFLTTEPVASKLTVGLVDVFVNVLYIYICV